MKALGAKENAVMDPAYLSGLAVFSGSVVGALTSLVSATLTKKHEAHARRTIENKLGCQKLYAQFIDEALRALLDRTSERKAPARTRWPSRSISGARAARSPAIWATLSRVKRRSSTRAAPAPIPTSSSNTSARERPSAAFSQSFPPS